MPSVMAASIVVGENLAESFAVRSAEERQKDKRQISLTGLSAYQGPISIFSLVSRTGRQSAYHPAGQPIAGISHLSGYPPFHPPEPRSRVKQKTERPGHVPPARLKYGLFRPRRAALPQITMNDSPLLAPWFGETACADSGRVCARQSDRRMGSSQIAVLRVDTLRWPKRRNLGALNVPCSRRSLFFRRARRTPEPRGSDVARELRVVVPGMEEA